MAAFFSDYGLVIAKVVTVAIVVVVFLVEVELPCLII